MKLAKFKNKYYFIPDYGTFITPNVEPSEIISLDHLTKEDRDLAKKNPNDPKIIAKGKKE